MTNFFKFLYNTYHRALATIVRKTRRYIFMENQEATTDNNKIRFENDMSFNRDSTLISSGSLVLSVGFIEKIILIDSASFILLLYLSWLLFAFSLCYNLYCFLRGSDFGFELSIKENNKPPITDVEYNSLIIEHNKQVTTNNNIILSSIISGILIFLAFIVINITFKQMDTKKHKTDSSEVLFLNEDIKYSLKRTNTPSIIVIDKPVDITTTITQTNDTIIIKLNNGQK